MSHGHPVAALAMAIGLVGIGIIHVHSQEKFSVLTNDRVLPSKLVGCVVPEQELRILDLLLENDPTAAADLLMPLERLQMCRWIDKDTRIAVEDQTVIDNPIAPDIGNMVCIRPHGDPSCYWTPRDSVFPKS